MFTSHYEISRCFDETKDGSFGVIVHGDWLPRHLLGCFHIVFATLRNIWLALVVALTHGHFDVFICDQVCFLITVLVTYVCIRLLARLPVR